MGDIKAIHPKRNQDRQPGPLAGGVRIGQVVRIDERGAVHVEFPGNDSGPLIARPTTGAMDKLRDGSPVGREVLLVFDDNDHERPVIIDTMEQPRRPPSEDEPTEVLIDGKRITLEGKEEIVLRCGEASITLTRAGKILLKGNYLISRSSGANRIKGASVQIN